VNPDREKARRWVLIEDRSDADIGHDIVVSYDEGPARSRMHQYVEEARAEARARPAEFPAGLTNWQRQKIAIIPEAVSYLRRTTGRVSVASVARRIEVDRGTVTAWIKKGLVPPIK
jgi:hypothetical protein